MSLQDLLTLSPTAGQIDRQIRMMRLQMQAIPFQLKDPVQISQAQAAGHAQLQALENQKNQLGMLAQPAPQPETGTPPNIDGSTPGGTPGVSGGVGGATGGGVAGSSSTAPGTAGGSPGGAPGVAADPGMGSATVGTDVPGTVMDAGQQGAGIGAGFAGYVGDAGLVGGVTPSQGGYSGTMGIAATPNDVAQAEEAGIGGLIGGTFSGPGTFSGWSGEGMEAAMAAAMADAFSGYSEAGFSGESDGGDSGDGDSGW